LNDKDDRESKLSELRSSAALSTVGLTLALSIGVGIGGGLLLDRLFKTNWIVMVGAVLGIVAGFKQLFEAASRMNREEEKREAQDAEERR
jgi:F0F1-type ATP synthase assembly protein I